MAHIEVEHVFKVFGRDPNAAVERLRAGATREELQQEGAVAAVVNASFSVHQGEIFVVMGLSGSGKSTLVRTLNRLFEPTAGRIVIDDVDVTALDADALRDLRATKISMVFQHFALFPHRTVLENAAWGLEVSRAPTSERRERAAYALEMVGLGGWESSYPQQLSGGMQQRVGLARALATDADILLMDEAFSALDPLIRREMQDQLIDLQQNLRKTIVFITHDLNEAMRLGDRIAVLKDGRMVQIGTAEEILTDPANDYVASFVQDVDRARVLTAGSVMERPAATIDAHEGPRAAIRIMRELQVSTLFVVGPNRRLDGVVTDVDVAEAARRGDTKLDGSIHHDFDRIEPETYLVECLMPAAKSTHPLAVVEDHRLVGVVPRVTLLAALGGASGEDGDASGPPAATEGSDGAGAPPHTDGPPATAGEVTTSDA